MNKKVLFGMFGLAAGSLMADNAVTTFNPYVAVKGGYSILSKKDEVKYKNGFVGAAEFGVSYDAWRLGLEVAYRQNKINNDKTANVVIKNWFKKINALSAMVNVYYDYALTDECSLYLGLGLGTAKASLVVNGGTKLEISKTVFAWQVMTGVAYDINENWTVEAGYRLFNISKVKVITNNNGVTRKIKMPFASSLELGLRYNF
jgi:OmpA-OmpF porin, OOP family